MESSPEVRQAKPEDADGIARVQNRAWRAAYEHVFGAERLARLSDGQRASAWRARLAGPAERTRVLVAGCREAVAARQLGFVPTGGIGAALEMARGRAGRDARIGFLLAPPYFPVRVGSS